MFIVNSKRLVGIKRFKAFPEFDNFRPIKYFLDIMPPRIPIKKSIKDKLILFIIIVNHLIYSSSSLQNIYYYKGLLA